MTNKYRGISKESGEFVEGYYFYDKYEEKHKIIKNEYFQNPDYPKEQQPDIKIAIIEMESIGSIKDPNTDERNPVRITKDIYIEGNEIEAKIRINFNEIVGKEEMLNRIVKNLNVAVDIPFFLNFLYTCYYLFNQFLIDRNQFIFDQELSFRGDLPFSIFFNFSSIFFNKFFYKLYKYL